MKGKSVLTFCFWNLGSFIEEKETANQSTESGQNKIYPKEIFETSAVSEAELLIKEQNIMRK